MVKHAKQVEGCKVTFGRDLERCLAPCNGSQAHVRYTYLYIWQITLAPKHLFVHSTYVGYTYLYIWLIILAPKHMCELRYADFEDICTSNVRYTYFGHICTFDKWYFPVPHSQCTLFWIFRVCILFLIFNFEMFNYHTWRYTGMYYHIYDTIQSWYQLVCSVTLEWKSH